MDRIEFKYALVDILNEMSSDGALISLKKIMCNNGVIREGITISGRSGNTRPLLYLDDLYDKYREKGEMKKVAADILNEEGLYGVNITCVTEYSMDRVLDNVYFKLVNRQMNRTKLGGVPHFDYLDLSGTYFVKIDDEHIKDGIVNIDNRLMSIWNADPEELHKRAVENTSERFPVRLESVAEYLGAGDELHDPQLYLASSSAYVNGASVMAYPGFKDTLRKKFESDLYLIPSSIHELLIMHPDETDPDHLKKIIRQVNDTQLKKEELLGYELYRYDLEENEIFIV